MATSFEKKKQISWNLQLKSDEDKFSSSLEDFSKVCRKSEIKGES